MKVKDKPDEYFQPGVKLYCPQTKVTFEVLQLDLNDRHPSVVLKSLSTGNESWPFLLWLKDWDIIEEAI